MLPVSEEYSREILSDFRDMPYKVTLAGAVVYERNNVTNVSFSESVSGNKGIELGTSNSATVNFTLRDAAPLDYSGMYVKVESGLVLPSGKTEWIPMGEYWVTDFNTSDDYKTLKLSCADGMYHLSGEYVSSLTYPTDISNVVAEIITQTGIKFSSVLPKLEIRRKPEGLTYREVLGHLAGCCGKNARFNRQGILEFAWYTDTNLTINREAQYLNGFTKLNNKPLEVKFDVKGKDETYAVTIITDENGGVVATPGRSILEGETVVLSINPYHEYELADISAVTAGGKTVQLYYSSNSGRTFVHPEDDVTITASFKKIGSKTHSVILKPNENGGITASTSKASAGSTVTVYVSANSGYKLDRFSTIPSGISFTKKSETEYTFTMPNSDVTISANFSEIQTEYNISYQIDKGYMTVKNASSGAYVTKATAGTIITVTLFPQSGYEFSHFDSNATFTQTDTNVYNFIMPAENVSIKVYSKFVEDESKTGTYSWLQKPQPAPTSKPYWAVFYNESETLPTCQKYHLVWFDSWEATSCSEEEYKIRFDGYYYCGSKNNGHGNHEWDTSTWSGNGASGSTLEWSAYVDRIYADWDDYYGVSDQYCLIASNASLFYNGSVVFQNCEGAISATQTSYVQEGMDVREEGSLTRWHCPDTFSTPAPAANWMILMPEGGLYMTVGEDGKYNTPLTSYPKSLIAFFYDDIRIENIGAIFSDVDEEVYIASFTNARWTYLRDNVLGWDEEIHDLPEGAVVGFRSPLNSTKAADGYLDGNSYNFAGVLVTSQTLYDTSGNLFMYNNACRICDCASETSTFVLRRSFTPDDAIVIDSPYIEVATRDDAIILRSSVATVTTQGDALKITLDKIESETVEMEYTNPLIYKKMIPFIQPLVQSITYTPAKVKHRGNPALQAGDIVRVPDKHGLLHTVLIMQQTINLGGGMNSEISCSGENKKNKSFTANTPTQTQIKKAVEESNIDFERRMAVGNSLVYAALHKDISSNASKIEMLSEYQNTNSVAMTELELKATKNEATLKVLSEWQDHTDLSVTNLELQANKNEANIGLVVKNGKASARLILQAINNQSGEQSEALLAADKIDFRGHEFEIDADHIKFSGQKLDVKVDATNIEGEVTADQINAEGLKVRKGIIGGWTLGKVNVPVNGSTNIEADALDSGELTTTKDGRPYTYRVYLTAEGVYVAGRYDTSNESAVPYYAHKTWLDIVGG